MVKTLTPIDRRIIKTKSNLTAALLRILREKPLSELTVRELCREAQITTITFYAHYKDKFALADEVFKDLADRASERFEALQESNNSDWDIIQACCNLLDGILAVFQETNQTFHLSIQVSDPYLFFALSRIITERITEFLKQTDLNTSYSPHQVSAFLCYGLWGFICDDINSGVPMEEIQKDAKQLLRSLIRMEHT